MKEDAMVVGVIGSGSIGPDLAYGFVTALAGTPGAKVWLHDIKQEALDAGVARIRGYVKKGLAGGKLTAKAAAAIEAALVPTLDIGDLADCHYVLEAASEDLRIKRAILSRLEQVVRPDCLIGFATSGIPRAQIASETKHPERCFVNHPFFPAWRSLPIEVVLSGDEALGARMIATLKRLGKVPVITADVACFAADDIFCNYISEAVRIVEDGVATPAQVDRIVNDAVGGGGPFNVMDGTRGNLLTAHCQELMRDAPTGSAWFEAPKLLSEQGNKLWHDPKNPGVSVYDAETAKQVLDRILAVLLARTYFVLDYQICAARELNWMTRTALGFTSGLLEVAEQLGADRVAELCEAYAAKNPGFEVPPSIQDRSLPAFYKNVALEQDGEIAVISVMRPEVKNALDRRTITELSALLDQVGADPSVRGVVLTSYDGGLAGADIGELASLKTPEACVDICMFTHPIFMKLSTLGKPTVAAVDGPVLGGGAELSMCCWARVVGPKLMLGQPEVDLGIIPGYGGTQRLPRLIGVERALTMMRTGRPVAAAEACAWGWAHGQPEQDPLAAAKALIRAHLGGQVQLAPLDTAPLAVPDALPRVDLGHHSLAIDAILVDVTRRGLALPLDQGLAVEAQGFGRCKRTRDLKIGLTNFTVNGPRVPAAFLNE